MRPIVNVLEEDRARDIDNMHKKFGEDRACDSGDIVADRQTHRQTYSSQYIATAPAGELMNRSRDLTLCLTPKLINTRKTDRVSLLAMH